MLIEIKQNFCACCITIVPLLSLKYNVGMYELKKGGGWRDVNTLQVGSFGFFVLLSFNLTS